MTPDEAVHRRLMRWQGEVRLRMASRQLDLPFATVVISDDMTDVYDQNLVIVTTRVPAHVLVSAADRVAATVGWRHRRIEIADATVAAALRTPLIDAGYVEERLVTMALGADRSAHGAAVRDRSPRSAAVVAIDDQPDLARAVTAQQPWADSERLIAQMLERERRLAHIARARAVVAPPAEPVSRCLMLTDPTGEMVEIDAVSTLAGHRGRGWSRAVLDLAIAEARAADAAHVVLVAAEDDWPRTWYERLGFRTVGRTSAFHRAPTTG